MANLEMLTESGFNIFKGQLIGMFRPNDIYEAPLLENRKYHVVEEVNLEDLPQGTKLAVACSHPSAGYTMEIEQIKGKKVVHIWRNPFTNGLVGPLESIVSYEIINSEQDNPNRNFAVVKGSIRKGKVSIFPYFTYGEPRYSVQQPTELWIDTPQLILVQLPNKHPLSRIKRAVFNYLGISVYQNIYFLLQKSLNTTLSI